MHEVHINSLIMQLASLVLSALGMSKVLEGNCTQCLTLRTDGLLDVEFERRMSNILDVVTKNQGGVPITEARRAVLTQAFEPVSSDNPDVGDLKELFVNALAAAPAIPSSQSEEALYYMRYYYRHQAIALDGRMLYGDWYDENRLPDISQRLAIAENFFLSMSSTYSPTATSTVSPTTASTSSPTTASAVSPTTALTVNPTSTVSPTAIPAFEFPAWRIDYDLWPSTLSSYASHHMYGFSKYLAAVHKRIPLDASHKQELLEFWNLVETKYATYVDKYTATHIEDLRNTLDSNVKLHEDVNYAAFLEAEGELLRTVYKCWADKTQCGDSDPMFLTISNERFKVPQETRGLGAPSPSTAPTS